MMVDSAGSFGYFVFPVSNQNFDYLYKSQAYVNIHTSSNPSSAIAGSLVRKFLRLSRVHSRTRVSFLQLASQAQANTNHVRARTRLRLCIMTCTHMYMANACTRMHTQSHMRTQAQDMPRQ